MPRTESLDHDALYALIPEVLAAWRACLRNGDDLEPRAGERGRAEEALLRALLGAALAEPDDDDASRTLIVAAITYGSLQPLGRVEPMEVCRQLSCLRDELFRLLKGQQTTWRDTTALILRVDGAISVATRAVIRGGHENRTEC